MHRTGQKIRRCILLLKISRKNSEGEITMAFFAPIPLIRKNHIIARLQETGAFSAETSKTLTEAGVINPNGFKRITERLVRTGAIKRTEDGRYYL